jgi:hypothetical protein
MWLRSTQGEDFLEDDLEVDDEFDEAPMVVRIRRLTRASGRDRPDR